MVALCFGERHDILNGGGVFFVSFCVMVVEMVDTGIECTARIEGGGVVNQWFLLSTVLPQ